MDKKILTPQELLLLCVLRNKKVEAVNLKPFTWTCQHESYFNNQMSKRSMVITDAGVEGRTAREILKETIKREAEQKFGILEPACRAFIVFGRFIESFPPSLASIEPDLTWWALPFDKEDYNGTFELREPLTHGEEEFLKIFCSNESQKG